MKKYDVTITKTTRMQVEAEDEQVAREAAKDLVREHEIFETIDIQVEVLSGS
jgi:hypothetical protein